MRSIQCNEQIIHKENLKLPPCQSILNEEVRRQELQGHVHKYEAVSGYFVDI